MRKGLWHRFYRDYIGANMAASQNSIASDISSDIYEEIIFAQKMQYKSHIRELMKSTIQITSGPSHTPLYDQFCFIGVGINNRIGVQPGIDLPFGKSSNCIELILPVQRMVSNKFQ